MANRPAPEGLRADVVWIAPYPGGWARNFRFGEWLGDPITPLFETCLLPTLERAFWAAQRRVADMPTPQPTYVVVHGWYFTTMNFWPRHSLGWLWQIARHPKLLRVMLQFVPGAADWALAPWVREWRTTGVRRYGDVVESAEAQVDRLGPDDLLQLIHRVGAAAGEYFVWIALVAGAGYKTEAPLARFYQKYVFPHVGGSHQTLLAGLTDPTIPPGAHALHSLDWWQPTLGEVGPSGDTGETGGSGGPPNDRTGRPPDRLPAGRAAREVAEVAVRASLAQQPRRLRQFEQLLDVARRYAALREEIVAPFTIGWPVLRRAARRLGDELVRTAALDARDGVFFLTQEEVIDACRSGTAGSLSERIAGRRQEWERRRALVPPLRLGQIPATFKRGLDQLEADLGPATGSNAALRGLPASPGLAIGPVRIIRGPAEFADLQPGDILVAPATAPAWTPLFARAAAVVTDTGSILAHTSLVAREYGIPAVVGTGDATARLRNGQVVAVDGNSGVIELRS